MINSTSGGHNTAIGYKAAEDMTADQKYLFKVVITAEFVIGYNQVLQVQMVKLL